MIISKDLAIETLLEAVLVGRNRDIPLIYQDVCHSQNANLYRYNMLIFRDFFIGRWKMVSLSLYLQNGEFFCGSLACSRQGQVNG